MITTWTTKNDFDDCGDYEDNTDNDCNYEDDEDNDSDVCGDYEDKDNKER